MEYTRRNKIIILTILLITLVGLISVVVISLRRPSGIAVQVTTVPKDAKIVANNKKIRNGTTYLEPGSYKVEISKKGFATIKSTIVINANRTYIQEALSPVSESAKAWAAKNNRLYMEFEGLAGKTAQKTGENFYKRNPIAYLLPIDKLVYKIGYLENEQGSITLTVHAVTPEQRTAALQQIRDWGYDPTDYEIEFVDYVNPLAEV